MNSNLKNISIVGSITCLLAAGLGTMAVNINENLQHIKNITKPLTPEGKADQEVKAAAEAAKPPGQIRQEIADALEKKLQIARKLGERQKFANN